MSGKNTLEEFQDSFQGGNKLIEAAFKAYEADETKENQNKVLEAIRARMRQAGHFMVSVIALQDGKGFVPITGDTPDGKTLVPVFTSNEEYKKGEPLRVISNPIHTILQMLLKMDADGLAINPWGNSFLLTREMAEQILQEDARAEDTVPDVEITRELLEDGSFLKKALEICNRNETPLNMLKLMKILRDSYVWIPCSAILSDTDPETMKKLAKEVRESGKPDSPAGKTLSNQDNVIIIPDILKGGGESFLPVFTSADEKGEHGKALSRVQRHFLEATKLARSCEKDISGIVINAFTERFVIPVTVFDTIAALESNIENK